MALAYKAKIIVDLQPEPGFRRNTKISPQPQSRIGRDGAFAIYDRANSIGRDVEIASQLVDADPEWLHEVFQENLSGMDWVESL